MSTSPAPSPLRGPVPLRPPAPSGAEPALPRPLTSFVGRAREVAAMRAMLQRADVRLLTLTGPGGVGKTRLALRVAEDLSGFPDGVWFVALAPVRDPALVGLTIAQTLGVQPAADEPVEPAIGAFLADRRALLILDNFEHVLDAAPLLSTLLARCPALKILVTSRAVSRVSGEHVYALPPMLLPDGDRLPPPDQLVESDAVRLFVERATASVAGFTLTPDNALAVIDICRRLDGLPLAIELAAARVGAYSPTLLRQRLDDRFGLLADGPRDQPSRLRSMRDAVAWSYDLLDEAEQVLFRRLAVFVGSWTIEAAEAVGGEGGVGEEGRGEREEGRTHSPLPSALSPLSSPPSVLETLASLIGKSLVWSAAEPAGAGRYVMLETTREYALERLGGSGEAAAVRERHAAYFLELAEQADWAWFRPNGETLLNGIEAELPNLRAALAWLEETGAGERSLQLAGALRGFWLVRGHRREGQAWLEQALGHRRQVPAPLRVRALGTLSWIMNQRENVERALVLAEEGLALAREGGDRRGMFFCTILAGVALAALGKLDQATLFQEEALTLLETLDDPEWPKIAASTVLDQLGGIALHRGDVARAAGCFTEALDRQRELGYAPGTSHPYASHPFLGLGDVARAEGDDVHALGQYQKCLGLAWPCHDMRAVAYALGGVAGVLAATGHEVAAARMFGASGALYESIGSPFGLETFDRQRAFGLPEPWARRSEPFGKAQALRDALGDRTVRLHRSRFDPESVTAAWSEGRALPVADAVADALAARLDAGPPTDDHTGLTAREREVLRLLADGKTDREIAAALFISHRTAASHVRHIYDKLDVTSRAAATAYAVRHGLA